MSVLFFTYDGHNYSRYLTWFDVYLTNLESTDPRALELIDNEALSLARSLIPGSLSAVDKTMEETFMKFAKGSGGLLHIFEKHGTYQRWCRTTSARAKLFEKTIEICGLSTDPD